MLQISAFFSLIFATFAYNFSNFYQSNERHTNCLEEQLRTLNTEDGLIYIYDDTTAKEINKISCNGIILWHIDEKIATTNNEIQFNYKRYILHVSTKTFMLSFKQNFARIVANKSYWRPGTSVSGLFTIFANDLIDNCTWIETLWKWHLLKVKFVDLNNCNVYTYDPFEYAKNLQIIASRFTENGRNAQNLQNCLFRLKEKNEFDHLNDMKGVGVNTGLVSYHFVEPYLMASTKPPGGLLINPLHLWSKKFNVTPKYADIGADLVKNINDRKTLELIKALFENGTFEIGAPYPYAPFKLLNTLTSTDAFLTQSRIWMVPKPRRIPNWRSILQICTSFGLWSYIFLTLFVIVTFFCYVSVKLYAKRTKRRYKRSCGEYFMDTLRICVGNGVPIPQIDSIRILLLAYVLFSLHVNYIFQGLYSSILTVPQYEQKITNVEELVLRSNLKLMINSNNVNRLQTIDERLLDKIKQKMIVYDQMLGHRSNYVKLNGDRAVTGFRYRYDVTESHKKYVIDTFDDTILEPLTIGYILNNDSPYLNSLNFIVNVVNEAGLLTKWKTDYDKVAFITDEELQRVTLTFEHVHFVFVLLAIGLAVASLTFVIELFIIKRNQ